MSIRQFKNLVSVRRDKKDFYFLDKFVPPPPPPSPSPSISVTPTVTPTQSITPTPTLTPTLTPTTTLTPTPTPSLAPCDLSYEVFDEASVYSFVIDTTLSSIPFQTTFESPTVQTTDNLFNIDFGNGTVVLNQSTSVSITQGYSSSGTYTIRMYPNVGESFKKIQHSSFPFTPTEISTQVTEVLSWGAWASGISPSPTYLNDGLAGCDNLTTVPNVEPGAPLISSLFSRCVSFTGDTTSWNMSGYTSLGGLFYSATTFNQDISGWDTSNLSYAVNMFSEASSFNQDLGSWNISSLSQASGMFDNTNLSTTNYDNILIGWAAQAPSIQSGVTLGAAGINRTSASASAYTTLTTTYGWTINDAGQI